MQNKRIYIDVETTGTDPNRHGIIQLAGIILIDGEEKETFNFNVRPLSTRERTEEALKVTGKTDEEIDAYPSHNDVHEQFVSILERFVSKFDKYDKFHFIAYNSPFDNQFVREFFKDAGDEWFGSYFWTPDICVMRKAADELQKDRFKLRNFQLSSVAAHLGIELDGVALHDALADIRLTIEVDRAIDRIRRKRIEERLSADPAVPEALQNA